MEKCSLPPKGWYCTRDKDHDGPCAARPSGPPFMVCEACGAKTPVEPHNNPRYHDYDPVDWFPKNHTHDLKLYAGNGQVFYYCTDRECGYEEPYKYE